MIVCTRDRLSLLSGCLDSLVCQTTAGSNGSADRFDVLVVDNGSTDGTAAWLVDWAQADPERRRVVTEPVAGLSRARNRGVAEATGDVVLFIDDDALAPRGWVAAHLAAHRRDAATTAVGGPVVLTWPEGRPRWLTPGLEHWYSALDHGDHGDHAGPFPRPDGPYGANMSVRRTALTEAGGFAERLGRRGRSLLSGEEAELWQRLWGSGGTIVYDPATLVLHRVAATRSTRRWVIRRGWGQGRSNARLGAMTAAGPTAWTDVRGLVWCDARFARRFVGEAVRALRAFDQAEAIEALARATGHAAAALGHITARARRPDDGPATGRATTPVPATAPVPVTVGAATTKPPATKATTTKATTTKATTTKAAATTAATRSTGSD